MYSDNQSVQILISLLKSFGVKNAVLSPGSRNVPVVHSLEKDPYFQCYSIVDERSAAYFAIGLALETKQPVLISCTSGTAPTNYLSAVCEAFYQHLPLVVLTSDRNPYYLYQMEDQMMPQTELYKGVCKKSVSLPIIKDKKDYWYCRRIVNETLLEMNHHGSGPIHINIPTEWGLFAQNFTTPELPVIQPIQITSFKELYTDGRKHIQELKDKKRILVLYGQCQPINENEVQIIESFASKYNCIIAIETISNIKCKGTINTYVISQALTKEMFNAYAPDLVISLNGNYVSKIKNLLKNTSAGFEHWTVNEEGAVVDQFEKQTRVFECSSMDFFSFFDSNGGDPVKRNEYLDFWESKISLLDTPDFPYSNNYAMQTFLKKLSENTLLHLGNGMAIHLAQHFASDISTVSYCHSGTTTIDGSLSTFIGQAAVCNKPVFMFIGDLSFFYDMNALWNRYVGKNLRILLSNNEGGETFHWNNARDIDSVNLHTAAEHFATAKDWVKTRGFKYLSASSKEEFDTGLAEFMSKDAKGPIFFEVFTKKDTDARILLDHYENCKKKLLDYSEMKRAS